jgi:predicted secreted acid phosphatase
MDARPTPKYVFRNGDILLFHVSNKATKSDTLSFQHSLDEIMLHNLERRFAAMKTDVEKKKEHLMAKMKTDKRDCIP